MKNIFTTLSLKANLIFIAICFAVVSLVQFESLISATNRAVYLNSIYSSCDFKSPGGQYENIGSDEANGVPRQYFEFVSNAFSAQDRKLRKDCVLSKLSQSKKFLVKTDIGYQEVAPFPVMAGVFIGSLLVALSLLIIKIFLIKTKQMSLGLFRVSVVGIPVICFSWLISIHSFKKFTLGLFESITQTAMTLVAITFLYVLIKWIYKGFTSNKKS